MSEDIYRQTQIYLQQQQVDLTRSLHDRIANNSGGTQAFALILAEVNENTRLINQHAEAITHNAELVEPLFKRVAAQKKRIQSLLEDIDAQDKRIESLKESIEGCDLVLDSHIESLDTHTEDINALKQRLAALESFIRTHFRQGRDITERKSAVFNDRIFVLVDPAKCKEKEALDVLVSDDPEWYRSIMKDGKFEGLLADMGEGRGSASRVSLLVKYLEKDKGTGEERVASGYSYELRGTFLWDDADIIVCPGTRDRVIHNPVDPKVTTLGGSGEEPTYANKPISELREKYGWPMSKSEAFVGEWLCDYTHRDGSKYRCYAMNPDRSSKTIRIVKIGRPVSDSVVVAKDCISNLARVSGKVGFGIIPWPTAITNPKLLRTPKSS